MTGTPSPVGEALGVAGMRVGLVVSRFPKFTETFVVNEIVALEALGLCVQVHPLLREEPGPHQPDAVPLAARARFGAPWGRSAWAAFGRTAGRQPRVLLGIVGRLVRDTLRHPPFLLKDLALLPRICEIAEEFREDQVEHVHAHFATHAGFAAWSIGRLTGLPYSIVAHGSDVHRNRAMLGTKVAEAAFVATISEFNRSVIVDACGPGSAGRVEVIHCGVDTSVAPHRVASTADQRSSTAVVCVGTLHEVKGQRHLIEAVAILAARGRPVDLYVIGDGEDRDLLRDLARTSGVDACVHFEGSMPHDDVLDRYRSADIVVAPSVPSSDGRREGIPTVLMEAMAAGVPVVASDLSGIPELVTHERTGLLVEPGDEHGIADALERLMVEPGLAARLAAAGRKRVMEDFSIDATSAAMAALIARSGGAHGR